MRTVWITLWWVLAAGVAGAQSNDDGLPGAPQVGPTTLQGRLLRVADYPHWKLVRADKEQVWLYPTADLAPELEALPTWMHLVPRRGETLAGLARAYHIDLPTLLANYPEPISIERSIAIPGCWVELEVQPVANGGFMVERLGNRISRFRFQARSPTPSPHANVRWLVAAGSDHPVSVSEGLTLPLPPVDVAPAEQWYTYTATALRGPDDRPFHVFLEAIQGDLQAEVTQQAQPTPRQGFVQRLLGGSSQADETADPPATLPAGETVLISQIKGDFAKVGEQWIPFEHVDLTR